MRLFILPTFLIFSIFLIGCGTSDTNVNRANTNAVPANNANLPGTTPAPETGRTNDAPTIAPVVQGFYDALLEKNEAGAKRFLSREAQKYWEAEAKEANEKFLPHLLTSEEPLDDRREVRNEKIEGETAVAEIRGGNLGVWTPTKFVREGGEWKFASPRESMSLQDIKGADLSPAAR